MNAALGLVTNSAKPRAMWRNTPPFPAAAATTARSTVARNGDTAAAAPIPLTTATAPSTIPLTRARCSGVLGVNDAGPPPPMTRSQLAGEGRGAALLLRPFVTR